MPSARLTEIARIQAALVRHRQRIDDMDREWRRRDGSCCPGCMFGAEYSEAVDKVGQVEAWLEARKAGRGALRASTFTGGMP